MKLKIESSDKEIEFHVYSNGEYADLFAFNRVLGKLVWKALAEIAETGDMKPLLSMIDHNRKERDSQYIMKNFWERFASEIIEKNTFPLNDYIEVSKLRQFQKTMQHLVEQGIVRLLFPKVNEILHIGLSNSRKSKSTVLTVIVKHSRKRYLKMCHGFPSPERREFFQCLHGIFGIPPSERRSFDRMLCRIINRVTRNEI
jgi:nitrogenase subunit NifH